MGPITGTRGPCRGRSCRHRLSSPILQPVPSSLGYKHGRRNSRTGDWIHDSGRHLGWMDWRQGNRSENCSDGLQVPILGLGIIVLPHLTLIFFWGLYAVAGIAVGITNAVMFLIPSYLKESSGEGVTLGIGVINTVQLLITSVFLSIFGFLSVTKGYTLAWTLIGVMAIVLLPLLLFVSSDGAKRSSNLQTGQVESGISPV